MEKGVRMSYIGIDCGSSACKVVLIDAKKNIIKKYSENVHGNVVGTIKNVFEKMKLDKSKLYRIGITGSSRILLSKLLHTNIVKSELIAHSIGAIDIVPNVRTIIEIGGQDSKLIIIENEMIKDFKVNSVCAAGTGAFLESQSNRLGFDISEFDTLADASTSPANISGKCSVFMESAVINQQKLGVCNSDIAKALCDSMADNYYNELIKGRKLESPIYMQGGVARISNVVSALSRIIDSPIKVMDECEYIGAYGMALCALRSKSPEICLCDYSNLEKYNMSTIKCSACPNKCMIMKYHNNDGSEFLIGGMCGKYI